MLANWRFHLVLITLAIVIFMVQRYDYLTEDAVLVGMSVTLRKRVRRIFVELRRPDVFPLLFAGYKNIYPLENRDETEWKIGQSFMADWRVPIFGMIYFIFISLIFVF